MSGYGGTMAPTGGTAPTAANPYGMSPGMLALMGGMQGLANTLNPQAAGSANYMRAAPQAQTTFGQPTAEQVLAMILQMRQAQAQGLGDPYQAGVAAPRVSLLSG